MIDEKQNLRNADELTLHRSLLGAISQNFRAVIFRNEQSNYSVTFVLAEENGEDREEIADVIFEFEASKSRHAPVESSILISRSQIEQYGNLGDFIFLRKE